MPNRTTSVIAILSLAAACTPAPRGLSWNVEFAVPADPACALRVFSEIRVGGCDSDDVVYEAASEPGGAPAPTPETLAPGTYGFYARAVDGRGLVYADGCEERVLPTADGDMVSIAMSCTVTGCACVPPNLDASVDGGDTGADTGMDGGAPDTGDDGGPSDTGSPTDILFASMAPHDAADFRLGPNWSFGPLISAACGSDYTYAMVEAGATWGDVEVSVRVRINAECGGDLGWAGLYVRAASREPICENEAYFCDLVPGEDRVYVGLANAACDVTEELFDPAGGVSFGNWYTLTLSAIGTQITCRVEGAGVDTTIMFTDGTRSVGAVGFSANQANVDFDDLVVRQR